MKANSRFAPVLLLAVGLMAAAPLFMSARGQESKPTQSTPTSAPDTVSRTFVLLMLTDSPPKLDAVAAAELQKNHLAHVAKMTASGKVLVAGPFSARDDERLRGALIFNCTIDEARAMASEDPAVKAGRLKVVCMNWNTAKEAMVFPAESKTSP